MRKNLIVLAVSVGWCVFIGACCALFAGCSGPSFPLPTGPDTPQIALQTQTTLPPDPIADLFAQIEIINADVRQPSSPRLHTRVTTPTLNTIIVNASWRFDDGGTAYGSDIEHTFTSTGWHNFSVSITDDKKRHATNSAQIFVVVGF